MVNGVGTLYTNAWQCAAKTVAAEGPAALYKGCTAHFLRAGPHTVLTLLLLDRMQRALGLAGPPQQQQAAAGQRPGVAAAPAAAAPRGTTRREQPSPPKQLAAAAAPVR